MKEKPFHLDMPFGEALARLSRVNKPSPHPTKADRKSARPDKRRKGKPVTHTK